MNQVPSRVQELIDQRRSAHEAGLEVLRRAEADGRELSAEENENFERSHGDVMRLTREIDNRTAAEEMEQRLSNAQPEPRLRNGTQPAERRDGVSTYEIAFRRYLRGGMRALDNYQAQALTTQLVDWSADPAASAEQRALTVTTTGGGYLVPAEFLTDLVRRQLAFGAVQRVARTINTESGAPLSFPTMDDTGNLGAILAINTAVSEQDVAVGTISLGAFMYTSKLIRVPFQLLMDAAFSLDEHLRDILAERIARILNAHFTTGAGTTEPMGLVTGGTSGVTAASATVIAADEIITLVHSVNSAYRNSGRARFMMNDTVLAGIRKLKATTNEYLWQPSMQAGVPDTLFGYAIEINDQMPAATANLKPVAFGDFFEGYLIRSVRGFSLLRLEERYADFLQVGFLGYARYDGNVRNAQAYRLITMAAV